MLADSFVTYSIGDMSIRIDYFKDENKKIRLMINNIIGCELTWDQLISLNELVEGVIQDDE